MTYVTLRIYFLDGDGQGVVAEGAPDSEGGEYVELVDVPDECGGVEGELEEVPALRGCARYRRLVVRPWRR